MNKIIVCPDSFKGCVTAQKVSSAISETIRLFYPQGEVLEIPLADGGEGTIDLLANYIPLQKVDFIAYGPMGNTILGYYYVDPELGTAYIESAKIIGLPLVNLRERNPYYASSYGLGQVILNAYNHGCREIFTTLGGSATCDAGMGMLEALGVEFNGPHEILLHGNGFNLSKILNIDTSNLKLPIKEIKFHAICDVANPLLGNNGTVKVFASQKGAKEFQLSVLDYGMQNFCKIGNEKGIWTYNDAYCEGAGAAGGLGFTFLSFFKAQYINGIQFVLKQIKFREKLKDTDLIITGEGKVDCQSLMGKVLSGVLKEAQCENIPVMVIAGEVEDKDMLYNSNIKEIYHIADPELSHEENMKPEIALQNIRRIIKEKVVPDLGGRF